MEIPKFLKRKQKETYEETVENQALIFTNYGIGFVQDTQLWEYLGITNEDGGMLAIYCGRKFLQKCLALTAPSSSNHSLYADALKLYEQVIESTIQQEEDATRRGIFNTLNIATNDLFTRIFQKDGRVTDTPDGMDSDDFLAWSQRWSERINSNYGNSQI